MRLFMIALSLWTLWIVSTLSAGMAWGQETRTQKLEKAKTRLHAIYEQAAFRAKPFRAQWLPDGTGYTMREQIPGESESALVAFEVATGKRTVLEQPPEDPQRQSPDVSPDGRYRLDVKNGDLYVRDLKSAEETRLTQTATQDAVRCGRAVWSPDGQRIAFVRTDSSEVPQRSFLIPGDPSYPTVQKTRFARVGGTIPQLQVGVVAVSGGEIEWLEIAEPGEDFYLGQLEWAGTPDELLVEKLSRFRDEREILLANLQDHSIDRIFHELDPAWVVASYETNVGIEWIRDGKAFLVLSEQDGWRHAYLYSREGEQQALLTPGPLDIIDRAHVDEAGGWFYYYASPDNATQKYLYRVALDGSGSPERVTPSDQPGTHDYEFSPDAQWAFHTYSTFDSPPITELVRLPEHDVIRVLEANEALREKMEQLIVQPTEFFQLEIGNGVTMDGWMIKPPGFDPTKKYPLFVYVYGEPHAQTVLDAWDKVHADYHRLLAELGYLVVSMDNRGTPAPKGATWRRAVFGSLGPLSTNEQAAGVQALAHTRSYVDDSRVGIWGWSGGGSNTLNAMFRKPETYQVGIAVAPKPQPHLYNAWFQEIYMETRKTNPDGYRRSAPLHFAEGLAGDLLIVHGNGETNTHIQITEGLVDRLIELGKPFDYMVYPHRDHGLREGPGTAIHLRMLMVRYLLDHLQPGPR